MGDVIGDEIVFVTTVRSAKDLSRVRLLKNSIRSFGGALSQCPFWLFAPEGRWESQLTALRDDVQVFPLSVPDSVEGFWFANKVCTCAQAEEMAASTIHSLVWIAPGVLVIKPPLQFSLGGSFDAAVRPVHIRNVGLLFAGPLDGFWKKIMMNAGVEDIGGSVETFVEGERIRPYFNSHAFAINPSKGLLRQWFERFVTLVCDQEFRSADGQDQVHQIFLHQAVWSVLLATSLDPERIHLLSPDYVYPYNLHDSVPEDRRAKALNDLVCIAYEDRPLDPDLVEDINILEPLRSWLAEHVTPN